MPPALRFKDMQFEWDPDFVLTGEGGGRFRPIAAMPGGTGANGRVLTAIDEDGQLLALKISVGGGMNDDSEAEVESERALARAHGDRFRALTLPILDAGKVSCQRGKATNELQWLVRPLGRGSLEEWLRDRRPLPARLSVLGKTLSRATRLHELGVVHRDLKPANFVWRERADRTVDVYVIDFGTVRELEPGNAETLSVRGTLEYMPCEAHLGVSSLAHDVFSCGMLAHRLIVESDPGTAARHHVQAAVLKARVDSAAGAREARVTAALGATRVEALNQAESSHFRAAVASLPPEIGRSLLDAVVHALDIQPGRRSLPRLLEAVRAAARAAGGASDFESNADRELAEREERLAQNEALLGTLEGELDRRENGLFSRLAAIGGG